MYMYYSQCTVRSVMHNKVKVYLLPLVRLNLSTTLVLTYSFAELIFGFILFILRIIFDKTVDDAFRYT